MNHDEIIENIKQANQVIAKLGLTGVPIEACSPLHLIVSVSDFNEHVDMQPAAIVYFGVLFKDAKRIYDYEKKSYERWKKNKLSDARKRAVGNKPTIAEVETQYIIDNSDEIEAWEEKMFNLKANVDSLETWYEGWKQKGFSLNLRAGLISDEMKTSGVILTSEKHPVIDNSSSKGLGGNTKALKNFMKSKKNN